MRTLKNEAKTSLFDAVIGHTATVIRIAAKLPNAPRIDLELDGKVTDALRQIHRGRPPLPLKTPVGDGLESVPGLGVQESVGKPVLDPHPILA